MKDWSEDVVANQSRWHISILPPLSLLCLFLIIRQAVVNLLKEMAQTRLFHMKGVQIAWQRWNRQPNSWWLMVFLKKRRCDSDRLPPRRARSFARLTLRQGSASSRLPDLPLSAPALSQKMSSKMPNSLRGPIVKCYSVKPGPLQWPPVKNKPADTRPARLGQMLFRECEVICDNFMVCWWLKSKCDCAVPLQIVHIILVCSHNSIINKTVHLCGLF